MFRDRRLSRKEGMRDYPSQRMLQDKVYLVSKSMRYENGILCGRQGGFSREDESQESSVVFSTTMYNILEGY